MSDARTKAALRALQRIKHGETSAAPQGGGGMEVRIYTGAAQPGPDAEAFGTATDADKTFPGDEPDEDDEDR